ncbi:MAG: toll/interleukin-1 receptor domain-containing protein, partial [Acidobacteriota bacterium]
AMKRPPPRLFLSYSSRDGELARRLATDLEAHGCEVWLDQWRLEVGQPFEQPIEQGIGEAELVLAMHAARRGSPSRTESLFDRARSSLTEARSVDVKDARNALAVARWTWQKAQAGLDVPAEERQVGLDAAREALRLDGRQMEALALEGALLTLDPQTREDGVAKIRDAIAGNAHLESQWGELARAG